jgi:chemotaxis signal transduction protein
VSRIEEFPVAGVEWIGTRPMIQYRDHILPLVDLCGRLDEQCQVLNKVKAKPLQVIVLSDREATLGIVVSRVLDIFEVSISSRTPANRVGMSSVVTLNNRIVEILDTNVVFEHQKRGTTHRLLTETAV